MSFAPITSDAGCLRVMASLGFSFADIPGVGPVCSPPAMLLSTPKSRAALQSATAWFRRRRQQVLALAAGSPFAHPPGRPSFSPAADPE